MTILAACWDYATQICGNSPVPINSGGGVPDNSGIPGVQVDSDYGEQIHMASRGYYDFYLDLGSNQTSFWLHCDLYKPTAVSNSRATVIEFWSASGTLQYTVETSSSGGSTYGVYKSTNGTSGDTQVGSDFTMTQESRKVFDIWINNGASGDIEVYVDGTITACDFSGNTTTNGDNAVRYITFRSRVASEAVTFSQIIASTMKTVGWKLCHLRSGDISGAPLSQWTGDPTSTGPVLATQAASDSAYRALYTNTNDSTQLFSTNDIPAAASGMTVKAVVVAAKFSVAHDSTPQNARLCVYTNSTLYESDTKTIGYGNGEVAVSYIWETNPSDGSAWTQSAVNAAFVGIKSKA